MNELLELFYAGAFGSRHDDEFLIKAEERGTLKKLLCVFQLPLRRFADVADRIAPDCKAWIKACKEKVVGLRFPAGHPTPEASLLANFLLVPEWHFAKPALMVMNQLLAEMIVPQNPRYKPICAERLFPDTLGVVFVYREITKEDVDDDTGIVFDPERKMLSFSGMCPKEKNLKKSMSKDNAVLEPDAVGDHREQLQAFGWCATTRLMEVTLERQHRPLALIPEDAKWYAFVLPCPPFPRGGWLYADHSEKLLAVNCVTTARQRTAFWFQKKRSLKDVCGQSVKEGAETTAALMKRLEANAFPIPEDDVDVTGAGAIACAWVGKEDLSAAPNGGFAYFFKDKSNNCFFEVEAATQVLDRAEFKWLLGRVEMNVAMLKGDENGDAVCQNIGQPACGRCCGRRIRRGRMHKVRTYRLDVPGVLHPQVLFGIAFSSVKGVCESPISKAIVAYAFQMALPYKFVGVFAAVFDLLCWMWLNGLCRTPEGICEGWDAEVLIIVSAIVWSIKAVHAVVLLHAYRKQHIGWSFLWSGSRTFELFCLCFQLPAMHHVLARNPNTGRYMVGLVAGSAWIRVLVILSGFETWDMGKTILPILLTMLKMVQWRILFVVSMFLASVGCVSYAMSDQDPSWLLLHVYQLAFTGDYPTKMFFSGHLGFLPLLSYALVGILIMVTLTNIFISLVGVAFQDHQDNAERIFVRHRAKNALDHALLLAWLRDRAGIDGERQLPAPAGEGRQTCLKWLCGLGRKGHAPLFSTREDESPFTGGSMQVLGPASSGEGQAPLLSTVLTGQAPPGGWQSPAGGGGNAILFSTRENESPLARGSKQALAPASSGDRPATVLTGQAPPGEGQASPGERQSPAPSGEGQGLDPPEVALAPRRCFPFSRWCYQFLGGDDHEDKYLWICEAFHHNMEIDDRQGSKAAWRSRVDNLLRTADEAREAASRKTLAKSRFRDAGRRVMQAQGFTASASPDAQPSSRPKDTQIRIQDSQSLR